MAWLANSEELRVFVKGSEYRLRASVHGPIKLLKTALDYENDWVLYVEDCRGEHFHFYISPRKGLYRHLRIAGPFPKDELDVFKWVAKRNRETIARKAQRKAKGATL